MLEVLPGLASTEHVDGTRRYAEFPGPFGSRGTPTICFFVPVVQDGLRVRHRHFRVRGPLSLEPDVPTVPTAGRLEWARQVLTGRSQTVVPNLVSRVLRVLSRNLGVRLSRVCKVPPLDDEGAGGLRHDAPSYKSDGTRHSKNSGYGLPRKSSATRPPPAGDPLAVASAIDPIPWPNRSPRDRCER